MISHIVFAAMEATHPHVSTQKSFYVEISRARDRTELVTDDATALQEQLEDVTGERISALEGIGEMKRGGRERAAGALQISEGRPKRGGNRVEHEGPPAPGKARRAPVSERGRSPDTGFGP